MKTVIMAGGFGTRLAKYIIEHTGQEFPKPMMPINGVPVLEREIIGLRDQGFKDIILTVSYQADIIMHYFGSGRRVGVHIDYYKEDTPLGNAGALYKLKDAGKLSNDFLLLNADSVFDIDFSRIVQYHREHKALATLFTHPNSHPYDSGLIITAQDGSNIVNKWLTKEDARPQWYRNCVNAGLHVLNVEALDKASKINSIDVERIGTEDAEKGKFIKVDLDRQILKPLAGTGKMFSYQSPEYVKDMGTPERFESVLHDYRMGIVQAKNLRNHQKAIFLDRDGTINKYVGFLRNIEQFELLPGVAEAIKLINASGYLAIVVTNQPIIARGEVTIEQLNLIHSKMETLLGEQGAYVDGLYYCPHHPDRGFEGEVPELKIDCDCRKPKPGMLLRASKDFNIDLKASWMVGDDDRDVRTGINAGCRTGRIGTDSGADVNGSSLLEVVKEILEEQ